MVDRFIVQSDTMENDVIDWIKSFGSGKKSINLFQTTRDLMFGEAGNFYILLARNAEAEEITGIAINSWNQHAFSFKYDTYFSYSKLTTNADLPNVFTGTNLVTLNSPSQLTAPGFYYAEYMSNDVNANSGSNPMSDYSTGDFQMLLLSINANSTSGCRYGTLLVTSPRLTSSLWIGQIWDYQFTYWAKK